MTVEIYSSSWVSPAAFLVSTGYYPVLFSATYLPIFPSSNASFSVVQTLLSHPPTGLSPLNICTKSDELSVSDPRYWKILLIASLVENLCAAGVPLKEQKWQILKVLHIKYPICYSDETEQKYALKTSNCLAAKFDHFISFSSNITLQRHMTECFLTNQNSIKRELLWKRKKTLNSCLKS